MSRKQRKWLSGACYHITHRCLERQFFLKFSKYRDIYQEMLFEASRKFHVDVLDYMITSNHVHLLVTAKNGDEISLMFKYLHGGFAQKYNFLKKRSGAFWSDRFHSTRIQDGEHFGRCLFYIDMNMMRAGAVKHPAEWKHTAFHEFVGNRERYKIVNMDKLLKILGSSSYDKFLFWYKKTLTTKVSCNLQAREAYWSKAFAVGSAEWLGQNIGSMKRMRIYDTGSTKYLSGKKLH